MQGEMTDHDNIIPLQSTEEIEAEAASWLTVLGRENLSQEDITNFNKWLSQSERHREAFEEIKLYWDDLAVLKELDDIAEVSIDQEDDHTPLFSRRKIISIAASIAAISLGGVYFLSQEFSGKQESQNIYATNIGEQRLVKLSDGSTLQLNTNTRAEVTYSRNERSVILTKGEAFFDIQKDTERPFLVYAANNVIKVRGTAFTVRLHVEDDVEVVVEEGRVQLASLMTASDAPKSVNVAEDLMPVAELTAGQNAVFNNKVERLAQLPQSDLSRKLSWRQGLLAYSGDPLYQVVEDISRYTNIHIEIIDPDLRELPVGGYFRVGEVEALFDSLELTFGLQVDRVSDNHVKLSTPSQKGLSL